MKRIGLPLQERVLRVREVSRVGNLEGGVPIAAYRVKIHSSRSSKSRVPRVK